jgi:DNA-binding response OmpR family regulator
VTTVLVIDDDPDIRKSIRLFLSQAGFDAVEASNGREGLRRFHLDRPDLVLLDVAMPELNGWETLDRLRDMAQVPVLMLTARGTESDRVRGLNAGADDYLVKPFSGQELIARVRALLRRSPDEKQFGDRIERGPLLIDIPARQVFVAGSEVQLTALEFRVLCVLLGRPRQVFSEEQLLDRAWNDPSEIGAERVKYVIHRLRRKLKDGGVSEAVIQSVRGGGYRYSDE